MFYKIHYYLLLTFSPFTSTERCLKAFSKASSGQPSNYGKQRSKFELQTQSDMARAQPVNRSLSYNDAKCGMNDVTWNLIGATIFLSQSNRM